MNRYRTKLFSVFLPLFFLIISASANDLSDTEIVRLHEMKGQATLDENYDLITQINIELDRRQFVAEKTGLDHTTDEFKNKNKYMSILTSPAFYRSGYDYPHSTDQGPRIIFHMEARFQFPIGESGLFWAFGEEFGVSYNPGDGTVEGATAWLGRIPFYIGYALEYHQFTGYTSVTVAPTYTSVKIGEAGEPASDFSFGTSFNIGGHVFFSKNERTWGMTSEVNIGFEGGSAWRFGLTKKFPK